MGICQNHILVSALRYNLEKLAAAGKNAGCGTGELIVRHHILHPSLFLRQLYYLGK